MEAPVHQSLEGHVALVSGSNRGLGAGIAAALAGLGCSVYGGARDLGAMEGVEEASNGGIHPVQLDVSDPASISRAVEHVADDAGRLDILVNNAGIGDWHGTTLANLDPQLLDKVLTTNLRGPMLLSQAALPHLLARPGSRIVNVSSGMGALGEGMSGSAPAYRVSKAGLNGLTAYLHGEYGPGLLANSVCPGWVRTDMGGPTAARSLDEGIETPVWLATFAPGAPSGLFWRDKQVIEW